jgi:hypothetical protein
MKMSEDDGIYILESAQYLPLKSAPPERPPVKHLIGNNTRQLFPTRSISMYKPDTFAANLDNSAGWQIKSVMVSPHRNHWRYKP